MARIGPTKGGRILVELPFGTNVTATSGKEGKTKFVKIKENVAKFLGFNAVTKIQTQKITIKTAAGNRTFERVINRGSYRRESVTLILAKPTKIGNSPGNYKTINVPLGSGCTVTDAVTYFQTQTSKGIVGLRTPDGRTIRWASR